MTPLALLAECPADLGWPGALVTVAFLGLIGLALWLAARSR